MWQKLKVRFVKVEPIAAKFPKVVVQPKINNQLLLIILKYQDQLVSDQDVKKTKGSIMSTRGMPAVQAICFVNVF